MFIFCLYLLFLYWYFYIQQYSYHLLGIILNSQLISFYRNTTMDTFVLVLFAILILEISAQWKNEWDRPLNFQCPSSKSYIYQIVSTHNNKKEDRRFDFNCRPVHDVAGPVSCSLSGIISYLSPISKWRYLMDL